MVLVFADRPRLQPRHIKDHAHVCTLQTLQALYMHAICIHTYIHTHMLAYIHAHDRHTHAVHI